MRSGTFLIGKICFLLLFKIELWLFLGKFCWPMHFNSFKNHLTGPWVCTSFLEVIDIHILSCPWYLNFVNNVYQILQLPLLPALSCCSAYFYFYLLCYLWMSSPLFLCINDLEHIHALWLVLNNLFARTYYFAFLNFYPSKIRTRV